MPVFLHAPVESAAIFSADQRLRGAYTLGHVLHIKAVLVYHIVKVLTALDGGAAFASVEGKQVSTWDGGWWAVSTMTTVGDGDLYLHTDEGRAIAIIVMRSGSASSPS